MTIPESPDNVGKKENDPTDVPGTVKVGLSEDFDDEPTRLIEQGETIEISSMVITLLSGGGQIGIAPLSAGGDFAPIPGQRSGQMLHLSYNWGPDQRIRLDFNSVYSKVGFWHTWSGSRPTAFYYNAKGKLLGQKTFTASGGGALYIEFSATAISRMEIQMGVAGDWTALDYFSFVV